MGVEASTRSGPCHSLRIRLMIGDGRGPLTGPGRRGHLAPCLEDPFTFRQLLAALHPLNSVHRTLSRHSGPPNLWSDQLVTVSLADLNVAIDKKMKCYLFCLTCLALPHPPPASPILSILLLVHLPLLLK